MQKICKKHGELNQEDIQVHPTGLRCAICHRINANKRRNGNREEFNARQALDKQLNPEKWVNEYKRQYRKLRENQGDSLSLIKVCRARRITVEQYYELVSTQHNKCAICNKEEKCIDGRSKDKKPRRLSIDHCHLTGKVRGLLCHSCNTAIGKLNDDLELFQKAMDYIIKHR